MRWSLKYTNAKDKEGADPKGFKPVDPAIPMFGYKNGPKRIAAANGASSSHKDINHRAGRRIVRKNRSHRSLSARSKAGGLRLNRFTLPRDALRPLERTKRS